MNKYVFWSVLNKHINVALTEDLSKYALGDTFWQAMFGLSEILAEWKPSSSNEESPVKDRLMMYQETGINKIELIVSREEDRFGVKCANSRSFFKVETEREALLAFIEARAKTSKINTGEGEQ